ncbi:Ribose-5-phosphate isomerase [Drechslerella dactyloides]|uniref:Ribose-5-phosphate isomerase n=1 Tax=Drechslerella dactyloides TaxID=74499 RepID=A0AAD6IZJ4_DREDA|nr:Ribose-5-phosphate isomerase [Drechslerella dactyloides]
MATAAEDLVASAKKLAAATAVTTHYPKSPPKYIGIGSGSTIVHVVASIAALDPSLTSSTKFIPTGFQSKQLLLQHNLEILDIDLLPPGENISVAFDGADEVDSQLNCIKGGGACLFQEKIVAVQAEKFVVVADFRKISKTLLTPTTWPSGIPIEVVPSSYPYVTAKLQALGATQVVLRPGGKAKAGPCVTDNGNFLLDSVFPTLKEGEDVVQDLAEAIKGIVGVVEHGLFYEGSSGWKGRPTVGYFGMEDGAVKVLEKGGWLAA